MILATNSLLDHIVDTPWPGCTVEWFGLRITWMSSGIATMILVAVFLAVVLPLCARRHRRNRFSLGGSLLEVIVVFMRDHIARPTLGRNTYTFLPFLLTIFVFLLAMNLTGLLPLQAVTQWASGHQYPVGHTPTSILTVCAALGSLALLAIMGSGLWKAARRSSLPMSLAVPLSPWLWFRCLAPRLPGATGVVMTVPLALLELIGVIAKGFALMVRLFANMVAGHIMLAVLMMFIVQTLLASYQSVIDPAGTTNIHAFYVIPICIVGSVLVGLMEFLVATLQAYIYTFLTAVFLGLYAEPEH